MGEVLPMPKVGDLFEDVRGADRTMRVSCHDDRGVVVVSLWADKVCRASFRLSLDDVPRMIEALGGCGVEHPLQEPTEPLELVDEPTGPITPDSAAS